MSNSIQYVMVKYVKRIQVGAIISSSTIEELVKVSSLGICDGQLVRGFGVSSSGATVYGRAIKLEDVIEVVFK